MSQIRRRGFTFAQLPEWVLYHPDLSDRAVRLFAVLDRFAGDSEDCWPSRKTLAERMGCSSDTIDRAKAELVKVGAIEVTHRKADTGAPTSNIYTLIGQPPGVAANPRPRSRRDAEGVAAGVRHEGEPEERDTPQPPTSTVHHCLVCNAGPFDLPAYMDHQELCDDPEFIPAADLKVVS